MRELFERWVGGAATAGSRRLYGEPIPYLRDLAHTFGVRDFMRHIRVVDSISKSLEARYGELDTQVLIASAAMWNGCPFCSVGHTLAANLLYFRDTSRLLALSESDVPACMGEPDDLLIERLVDGLGPASARLPELLRRQYEIASGERAESTEDDPWLEAALKAWAWLTECSVSSDLSRIPPLHAGVAKDLELRERYRLARAASSPEPG